MQAYNPSTLNVYVDNLIFYQAVIIEDLVCSFLRQ